MLPAKSSLTIPYRVVGLDGLASEGDDSGAGGGCYTKLYWGGTQYGWFCIAGKWVWAGFPVVFVETKSKGCKSSSTGIIDPWKVVPPSGKSTHKKIPPNCKYPPCGQGWNITWKSKPSPSRPCDPCDHPSLTPLQRECCHSGKSQPTGSQVDLVTGAYSDEVEDLPVQILGWRVPFERRYRENEGWTFQLLDSRLDFIVLNDEITGIRTHDGLLFSAVDEQAQVYSAGDGLEIFRLEPPPGGPDDGARWRLRSRSRLQQYFDADGRLMRLENRLGHTLGLDRDASGRVIALRDTHDSVFATYEYDGQGRVLAIECPWDGRRVEYEWTQGRLTQVTDPAGRVSQYTYGAGGRLADKRLPSGEVSLISYSGSGMVTSVLDEQGHGTYFDYGYDSHTERFYSAAVFTDGRMVERWFDKSGSLLETLVDGAKAGALLGGGTMHVGPSGQVQGITAPDGTSLESSQYDAQGQLVRQHDPTGVVTDYTYDDWGNVLSETRRQGLGGPVVGRSLFEYDALGRLIAETVDGLGQVSSQTREFEYDDQGNILRERLPSGDELWWTYDARGVPTSEADGKGNLIEWQHDAAGRLVERRITDAHDGATRVETWTYEPDLDHHGAQVGTRVTYTDYEGRSMIERWDARGRPVEAIDPWGRSTRLTYDSQGELVRSVTPEGVITEYFRETLEGGLRRVTRTVDDVVTSVEDRDAYGRIMRREVEGEEAHYFYDGDYPQPAEIVTPAGRILYAYDPIGNAVVERYIDDETGAETVETRAYQALRELSHTNPLGRTRASAYNGDGMPVLTEFPSGRAWPTEYDGAGRATAYPSASGDSALTLQYADGFRVSRRTLHHGGWMDYEYDADGQVAAVTTSWGGRVEADSDRYGNPVAKRWYTGGDFEEHAEEATFAYDSAGARTLASNATVTISTARDHFARTETTTYDFGAFSKTFTVASDSLGRVVGLTLPGGDAYGFDYDPFGRLAAVLEPEGASTTLDYPGARRRERAYPNGVVLGEQGTLRREPRRIDALAAGGQVLMDWEYELDGHLVAAIHTEAGAYAFSYDEDDQLVGATYPTMSADAFAYDLDGNRISSAQTGDAAWTYGAADGLLAIGTQASYQWSPAGDVVSRTVDGQTLTFEYDAAERLSVVRDGAGAVVAEYGYDADGLRVVKKVGAETTYAIYGPFGLLAEYDDTGAELRRYLWTPTDGAWQHELLLYEAQGARYYPLLDHRGEVVALTDVQGQLAWRAELRAFGEAHVEAQATVAFPLRPSGQYHDVETGLHYNTTRYYDPHAGAYLSVDPLSEASGDRNLYRFAFNNPIRNRDPLGLAPGKVGWEVNCEGKMSGLDFSGAECKGEINVQVHPLVKLKVSLSISNKREDCCKDGKIIRQGRGCIEVKITGSADVGFDPMSYIPARLRRYIGPDDAEASITFVQVNISGSCDFCAECGEPGYGGKVTRCCLELSVDGPNLSFNNRYFKVSIRIGTVRIGRLCYGRWGWSLHGPSAEGPDWGGGPGTGS